MEERISDLEGRNRKIIQLENGDLKKLKKKKPHESYQICSGRQM